MNRRRFVLGAVWAAAMAGCGVPRGRATPTAVGPISLPTVSTAPVGGKLLITRAGNFFVLDLETLREMQLSHFPNGAFATSPSLSPDRQTVAYAYYVLPKDKNDLGGNDLATMKVSGADSRVVKGHGQPGNSYEDPCWTPDGSALVATLRSTQYDQGKFEGVKTEIVRVAIGGTDVVTLIANGQVPALSPDGTRLAYLTADQQGSPNKLWIADGSGRNSRELLAGQSFTYVRAPRFSPDGSRIAFAGVGGPTRQASAAPEPAWSEIFGSAIAEAHGIPWEIWTVRPDGSDLRRLTQIQEDSPTPAWSPDGKWIAFAGEIGIYLVDVEGRQTARITTRTSGGGLTWLA